MASVQVLIYACKSRNLAARCLILWGEPYQDELGAISALGQKPTYAAQEGTPEADMCGALAHVCFGTIADIRRIHSGDLLFACPEPRGHLPTSPCGFSVSKVRNSCCYAKRMAP